MNSKQRSIGFRLLTGYVARLFLSWDASVRAAAIARTCTIAIIIAMRCRRVITATTRRPGLPDIELERCEQPAQERAQLPLASVHKAR